MGRCACLPQSSDTVAIWEGCEGLGGYKGDGEFDRQSDAPGQTMVSDPPPIFRSDSPGPLPKPGLASNRGWQRARKASFLRRPRKA